MSFCPQELWLRNQRWLQSEVRLHGKDLSVGISRGLVIGLYICTAGWCLSIRMVWFQFEAWGFVTLGNGHLQSELPVPGFVFLAVWFSHFVQWVIFVFVRECIRVVLILHKIWRLSATLFDLFSHLVFSFPNFPLKPHFYKNSSEFSLRESFRITMLIYPLGDIFEPSHYKWLSS